MKVLAHPCRWKTRAKREGAKSKKVLRHFRGLGSYSRKIGSANGKGISLTVPLQRGSARPRFTAMKFPEKMRLGCIFETLTASLEHGKTADQPAKSMSHAASIRRSDWRALLDLERKADELRRQADAKNRELHALWNEFNGLTDKADELNLHIASINNELASLEPAALEAQFKDLYGKLLRGWTGSFEHLNQIACIVATREWRIDALKDRANELEKELSDLKARSKVLAKKLGQKSPL
jgi:hypothetical protein